MNTIENKNCKITCSFFTKNIIVFSSIFILNFYICGVDRNLRYTILHVVFINF